MTPAPIIFTAGMACATIGAIHDIPAGITAAILVITAACTLSATGKSRP